jgi:hypothetical protein
VKTSALENEDADKEQLMAFIARAIEEMERHHQENKESKLLTERLQARTRKKLDLIRKDLKHVEGTRDYFNFERQLTDKKKG